MAREDDGRGRPPFQISNVQAKEDGRPVIGSATTHFGTAQRVRAGTPRRLNLRVLAGLLLTLVAFSGFVVFAVRMIPESRTVLVVARDLPPGTRLAAGDVVVSRVGVDETVYGAAVSGDALETVDGRVLAAPAYAGQVLARAQLQPADRPALGADQVAMTIPARSDSAVSTLRPGDHVAVLATLDKGKPTVHTELVLPDAIVYLVGRGEGGTSPLVVGGGGAAGQPSGFGTGNGSDAPGRQDSAPLSSLTLIVPIGDPAKTLATARWNGDLEIVLLPGQGAVRP